MLLLSLWYISDHNPLLVVQILSVDLYVTEFICLLFCVFSSFRSVIPRPRDHGSRHPLPRRAQWHNPESVLRWLQHAARATLTVSRNLEKLLIYNQLVLLISDNNNLGQRVMERICRTGWFSTTKFKVSHPLLIWRWSSSENMFMITMSTVDQASKSCISVGNLKGLFHWFCVIHL